MPNFGMNPSFPYFPQYQGLTGFNQGFGQYSGMQNFPPMYPAFSGMQNFQAFPQNYSAISAFSGQTPFLTQQNDLIAYQMLQKQQLLKQQEAKMNQNKPKKELTAQQKIAMANRDKDPKMVAIMKDIDAAYNVRAEATGNLAKLMQLYPETSPTILAAKQKLEQADKDWQTLVAAKEPDIMKLNTQYGLEIT